MKKDIEEIQKKASEKILAKVRKIIKNKVNAVIDAIDKETEVTVYTLTTKHFKENSSGVSSEDLNPVQSLVYKYLITNYNISVVPKSIVQGNVEIDLVLQLDKTTLLTVDKI